MTLSSAALRAERGHVILVHRHVVLRIENRGPPVCVKPATTLANPLHEMRAVVAEKLALVNLNLLRIEVSREDHILSLLYAHLTLKVSRREKVAETRLDIRLLEEVVPVDLATTV